MQSFCKITWQLYLSASGGWFVVILLEKGWRLWKNIFNQWFLTTNAQMWCSFGKYLEIGNGAEVSEKVPKRVIHMQRCWASFCFDPDKGDLIIPDCMQCRIWNAIFYGSIIATCIKRALHPDWWLQYSCRWMWQNYHLAAMQIKCPVEYKYFFFFHRLILYNTSALCVLYELLLYCFAFCPRQWPGFSLQ